MYAIPFRNDSNIIMKYQGMTKTKFKERIKEHKVDFKKCSQSIALSRLGLNQTITIVPDHVKNHIFNFQLLRFR